MVLPEPFLLWSATQAERGRGFGSDSDSKMELNTSALPGWFCRWRRARIARGKKRSGFARLSVNWGTSSCGPAAGSPTNPSLATPQLPWGAQVVGVALVRQLEISGVLWVAWPSDRRLESIVAARNLVVRSFLCSTGNLDWLNCVRSVSVRRRIVVRE